MDVSLHLVYTQPNGNSESEKGDCQLVIHFLTMPPCLKSIMIYHQIMLNGRILPLQVTQKREKFENYSYIWHSNGILKLDDLINYENGDSNPIFTLSMELLNVIDRNGKQLTDIHLIHELEQLKNNDLIYSSVSKSHEWKLENFNIATRKNGESVRSNAFNIDGFDFMLEFIPMKKSSDEEETLYSPLTVHALRYKCINLHFYPKKSIHILYRLPLNIKAITVLYVLKLKETESKCWWMEEIGRESGESLSLLQWDQDCLSSAEIADLQTLTFVVDIQILNTYDHDGRCIVCNEGMEQKEEPSILMLPEPQHHEWRVSPATDIMPHLARSTVIRSKIFTLFGVKWYFMLIPKGSRYSRYMRFFIGIADFPHNVTEIAFYCKSGTKQLNDTKSYSLQLNDRKHFYPLNCDAENEDLENVEEFTFNLEMILTAVYDKNGNDLSEQYFNDTDEKQEEINNIDTNLIDYKWNIKCTEPEILQSPFYVLVKDEIEFMIELNQKQEEIYVILNSMENLQQLSMKCVLKIEELDVIISGIVHFKRGKLKGLLIETMPNFETDMVETNILINMNVITKYNNH